MKRAIILIIIIISHNSWNRKLCNFKIIMKICHNQVTIVNWILFSVFFLFNSIPKKKLVRRLSHILSLFTVNDGTKAARPSHTMQYYNYFRKRACVCVCSSHRCQMYTSECERCISATLDSQHPAFRSNSWELIEFSFFHWIYRRLTKMWLECMQQ